MMGRKYDKATDHNTNTSASTLPKDPSADTKSNENDLSGEAAGVVRGVTRSVGRSVWKAPIGNLPKSSRGILRQKLPVRQVARVSDRMATGWDWWSSAVESNGQETSKRTSYWIRFRSFASNLARNTLLGMAVFESYGYVINNVAPTEGHTNASIVRELVDDENSEIVFDEPDEYAKAAIEVHFGAGFLAGSIHGVASTVFEGHPRIQRFAFINTLHHSFAHSMLFGGYESTKRIIINQMHSVDNSTQYFGAAYLTAFGVAGGIAGQLQHVVSHYSEQWSGLSDSTLRVSIRTVTPPTLRSMLGAFFPSAIGFIAFEYGKKLAA